MALCLGMFMLTGCQSGRSMDRDLGPTVDRDGQRRSLALDHPNQHSLAGGQMAGWWYDRNDAPRGTWVASDGLVFDESERTTWDRLHSHDGRVDDDFSQRTRKTRVRVYQP